MRPFGVAIPATVPQSSEIPEGLMNYPVYKEKLFQKCIIELSRQHCYVLSRTGNADKTSVCLEMQRDTTLKCKGEEKAYPEAIWMCTVCWFLMGFVTILLKKIKAGYRVLALEQWPAALNEAGRSVSVVMKGPKIPRIELNTVHL